MVELMVIVRVMVMVAVMVVVVKIALALVVVMVMVKVMLFSRGDKADIVVSTARRPARAQSYPPGARRRRQPSSLELDVLRVVSDSAVADVFDRPRPVPLHLVQLCAVLPPSLPIQLQERRQRGRG